MGPRPRQKLSWWVGQTRGLIMGVRERVMEGQEKEGGHPRFWAGTEQSTVRVTRGSLGRCLAGSQVLSWSPEGRSKSTVHENSNLTLICVWGPLPLPPQRGCGRLPEPASRRALDKVSIT